MTSIKPRVQTNTQPYKVTPDDLKKIPCPNLRTLVNEGWLTPDKDGVVDLKQLDAALKRLGVGYIPKKVLVKGAHDATADRMGEMATGKFNVFLLRGSNLDHPGDTRILRDGFNKERLDWLCSFASKDGRIGMKELAAAQKQARNDEPTTLREKGLGVAELTALLKVYGTPDASGRKSISVEGVRNLYEKSRFPDEWRAALKTKGGVEVNAQKTGLFRLIGGVIDMAFRQIGTPSGRGQMAMDMALGRDIQLNQTSAMGLAAGMCPAGPPVATPKNQANEAHAS